MAVVETIAVDTPMIMAIERRVIFFTLLFFTARDIETDCIAKRYAIDASSSSRLL
jgi:hypothetical protein